MRLRNSSQSLREISESSFFGAKVYDNSATYIYAGRSTSSRAVRIAIQSVGSPAWNNGDVDVSKALSYKRYLLLLRLRADIALCSGFTASYCP
jgi:hypothetical protein